MFDLWVVILKILEGVNGQSQGLSQGGPYHYKSLESNSLANAPIEAMSSGLLVVRT